MSVWYCLSDVKLAEALDDRASFRRFCGFVAADRPRSAQPLAGSDAFVKQCLDTVLFEAATRQLDEKNVTMKTGPLVDATIIASASIMKDGSVAHVERPGLQGDRRVNRRRTVQSYVRPVSAVLNRWPDDIRNFDRLN